MREVYLIGIGQTAVAKHRAVRGRYLLAEAITQAIAHADIAPAEIGMLVGGNMTAGILAQQQQLGALSADVAALRGSKRPRWRRRVGPARRRPAGGIWRSRAASTMPCWWAGWNA
jgi:acetyl-CoA acetyltransferase